jgi:hypothetical protein
MLLILELGFLRFGFGAAHLRRGKEKKRVEDSCALTKRNGELSTPY